MSVPTLELLAVNLSKIEAIVEELPRIGSRRELKVKADEILQLTDKVRRQAYAVADSKKSKTYVPEFKTWGNVGLKKDGE